MLSGIPGWGLPPAKAQPVFSPPPSFMYNLVAWSGLAGRFSSLLTIATGFWTTSVKISLPGIALSILAFQCYLELLRKGEYIKIDFTRLRTNAANFWITPTGTFHFVVSKGGFGIWIFLHYNIFIVLTRESNASLRVGDLGTVMDVMKGADI